MEPVAIPKTIDDPLHILLCSADEIVPFMVCMLTGMLIDQFIPSLAVGFIAVKSYRRFRDNRPDGYTLHALYWLGLLPSKATTIPNPLSVRLSDFLSTWEGHEAENRFSRLIILGLLVVCVITSLAAWRTERSIILVPPTLTKEVEVTRTTASSEFKESWGLFLAELLGNTTPANADFLKTAIEPLLAPDIYRTVLDAMTDQIKAIKMDRVAISFTPRHVIYEAESNKVFVSGELKSQGPSSKPDIKPRTYEFIIAIKNYRPRLEFIDVYPEDPRTLERQKAMQSQ